MEINYNGKPGDRPTQQYLGNKDKKEVHDLQNEQKGPNECQIDEILMAGNAVVFEPDTLDEAHRLGYDNGMYCIGNSKR